MFVLGMNMCHLPPEELSHVRGSQVKEQGRLSTGVTNPKELCVEG